jgi:hypothetical protein
MEAKHATHTILISIEDRVSGDTRARRHWTNSEKAQIIKDHNGLT